MLCLLQVKVYISRNLCCTNIRGDNQEKLYKVEGVVEVTVGLYIVYVHLRPPWRPINFSML